MLGKNRILLPVFWLGVILILSGYPGDKLPEMSLNHVDIFVHLFVYGLLSIFSVFPFYPRHIVKKRYLILAVWVVIFATLYGGLMEILQDSFFQNRHGSWYDFIANSIGALIGVILYPIIVKKLPINKL